MGWIAQRYGSEVHVVPDTDRRPHTLEAGCWCMPIPDDDDPHLLVHNDEADRIAAAGGIVSAPASAAGAGRACYHTIPVPCGWSAEQAWEAIRRGDPLEHPDGEPVWMAIETRQQGGAERLVQILSEDELHRLLEVRIGSANPSWPASRIRAEVERLTRHE